MTTKIASRWFQIRRISDRITRIHEPHVHPLIRCNVWHVRGRDRDLLVDTGLGIASLRSAAGNLFDKPLILVLTHTHFDHVGGAYEFESRIVHRAEVDFLQHPESWSIRAALRKSDFPRDLIDTVTTAGYVIEGDELVTAYPFEGFDPSNYFVRPATPARLAQHGDVIDLGDQSFEILHLPGHSPGSLGLWDSKSGTLFSGDAIYDGPLVDEAPASNIADYIRTMEMLRELPVSVVHGGHEDSFDRKRMIELVDAYLQRRRRKG